MKKIITFTAIVSAIVLSACGGGGDSSEQSNDTFKLGDRLYLINYSSARSNDGFEVQFIDFKDGQFLFSNSNEDLGATILTQNRLYKSDDRAEYTLNVHSPFKWTLNTIGAVKTDYEVERVNLSGKNIFDTILPGYREIPRNDLNSKARLFLIKDGLKNFPKGSICYRYKSTQHQVPFVSFLKNKDSIIPQTFDEFYESNNINLDYLNDQKIGVLHRLIKDQWLGIKFTSIFNEPFKWSIDNTTAIEFEQDLYFASYAQSFKQESQEEYAFYEKTLQLMDDPDSKKLMQLKMAAIKNGCQYFNDTAVKEFTSFNL